MRYLIPSVLFLMVLSLVWSCKKTDDFSADFKYDYFPIDTMHWVLYDVDSIVYDDFNNKIDTFNYQIREDIVSTFVDNSGRVTYRLERFYRENDTALWQIADVWFANRTSGTAEKVEENVRYIKLVFPIKEGMQWTGNAFVDAVGQLEWLEDWEYEITALDEVETIGGIMFDSTLTVLQTEQENLLEKIYATEKYARNVGLVYKELLHLEKDNPGAPWTEVDRGFIFKMTVKDYKK